MSNDAVFSSKSGKLIPLFFIARYVSSKTDDRDFCCCKPFAHCWINRRDSAALFLPFWPLVMPIISSIKGCSIHLMNAMQFFIHVSAIVKDSSTTLGSDSWSRLRRHRAALSASADSLEPLIKSQMLMFLFITVMAEILLVMLFFWFVAENCNFCEINLTFPSLAHRVQDQLQPSSSALFERSCLPLHLC